jgi:uncharacterized membrane protein
MQNPVFVLGLFILMGIVFVALGLPLKLEKVPPNWFYGFRTPKTLSSKEIWYPVNRVAGIDMIRTGVVLISAGLILLALRNLIAPETAVFILSAIGVGMTAWMVIHGFAVLRRM